MKKQLLSVGICIVLLITMLFLHKQGFIKLTDVSAALAYVLVAGMMSVLVYGFTDWFERLFGIEPQAPSLRKPKLEPHVTIRQNSLTFYKYPYLLCSKITGKKQLMTNTAYSDVYVLNDGRVDVEKCELAIELSSEGQNPYDATVLSPELGPDQKNLLTVSLKAGREVAYHPLALNLATQQAFLPRVSFNAGNFTGTMVLDGEYEIYAKAYYDGRQTERVFLGRVKIPQDLASAEYHQNIKVQLEKDSFAVSLEKYDTKIRARFHGVNDEEDVKRIIREHLIKVQQIDKILDNNGTLLEWSWNPTSEQGEGYTAIGDEITLTPVR
jgi:hypothetical protein